MSIRSRIVNLFKSRPLGREEEKLAQEAEAMERFYRAQEAEQEVRAIAKALVNRYGSDIEVRVRGDAIRLRSPDVRE